MLSVKFSFHKNVYRRIEYLSQEMASLCITGRKRSIEDLYDNNDYHCNIEEIDDDRIVCHEYDNISDSPGGDA